jgi:hypothetical protein
MGQKLRNVPSKSLFQGIDEALSAIKLLQHGLTHPLNPAHPRPRVWLGDWVLVRKVTDGRWTLMKLKTKDRGFGALSKLVWRAKLA